MDVARRRDARGEEAVEDEQKKESHGNNSGDSTWSEDCRAPRIVSDDRQSGEKYIIDSHLRADAFTENGRDTL